jgi:hypothetical protein
VSRTIAFTLVSLIAALLSKPAPASTVGGFLLKVTLVDPAATTDIQTRIVALEPFEYSELHNGAKITIKGKLSAPQKGIYHLILTIAEWRDEKTNSTEHYEIDLTPGKAAGCGFLSSFIYQRIILLTNSAQ